MKLLSKFSCVLIFIQKTKNYYTFKIEELNFHVENMLIQSYIVV